MNNRPVAWAYIKDGEFWDAIHPDEHAQEEGSYTIPLYTHSVKEYKEPSVKEIDDLWLGVINNIPENDNRPRKWHFARAILRKASDK